MYQGSPLFPIFRSLLSSLHHHSSLAQGHLHTIHPTEYRSTSYPSSTSAIITLLAVRYSSILSTCPNHLNTLWSALLRTSTLLTVMHLVQLLLHIDTSWPLSPNPLLLSSLFSAPHALYQSFILCTESFSHPPSAAICDQCFLKQSTSSNGSPFRITCIRPPFPYLEHLITLLLPTFTLNFFLLTLYQTVE